MARYHHNHIASRFYLRQWTGPNGRLQVVRNGDPQSVAAKPDSVGWRPKLWGEDVAVRQFAEEHLNRIETDAAHALRSLPQGWPPARKSRDLVALAFLVAIHLFRNPAGLALFRRLQIDSIKHDLPRYTSGFSADQVDGFLRGVASDGWRAETLLESLAKPTSIIGSMHWTLLEFEDPVLATSDHPVTAVPLLQSNQAAPVRPLPSAPMLEYEEVRMALGPRHALLCTWLDEPWPIVSVAGNERIATQLNRAVIAQSDEEWFHHPDRRPVSLNPDDFSDRRCHQIGRSVWPEYGFEAAMNSRRRQNAAGLLAQMIEDGHKDVVRMVAVDHKAA